MRSLIALIIFSFCLVSCSHDDSDSIFDPTANSNTINITVNTTGGSDSRVVLDVKGTGIGINWGDGEIMQQEDYTSENTNYLSHLFSSSSDTTYVIKVTSDRLVKFVLDGKRNSNASITFVRIGKGDQLSQLELKNLDITSLSVSNAPNLNIFSFAGCTQLTSFGFIPSDIIRLDCSNTSCPVQEILNNNPTLPELITSNNNLTGLDVSKNTQLRRLDISYNLFEKSGFEALFETLPTRDATNWGELNTKGNPGEDLYDKTVALEKNWKFVYRSE